MTPGDNTGNSVLSPGLLVTIRAEWRTGVVNCSAKAVSISPLRVRDLGIKGGWDVKRGCCDRSGLPISGEEAK